MFGVNEPSLSLSKTVDAGCPILVILSEIKVNNMNFALLSWLSVSVITPLHSYIHCYHYYLQRPTSKEKFVSFSHSLSVGVISPQESARSKASGI